MSEYRTPNYLPTYQLYPENLEKFHASQVKAICETLLKERLENEVYDHDNMQILVVEICDAIKANVKSIEKD